MAVITISRQFGAGGTTLGERLAKRLGYRYVDDELVQRVAQKMGVSEERVDIFEKKGTPKLVKLLECVLSKDALERRASEKEYVEQTRYVNEVKGVIEKLYDEGNVVIIGRGGNYTLQHHKNAVHVFLVGNMERRTGFLREKYKLSEEEAGKAIREADMIRERFLNCFSDRKDHDDPHLYTLVLNMNRINMQKAEDLIAKMVSDLES
jgi:cytidylate kinase